MVGWRLKKQDARGTSRLLKYCLWGSQWVEPHDVRCQEMRFPSRLVYFNRLLGEQVAEAASAVLAVETDLAILS